MKESMSMETSPESAPSQTTLAKPTPMGSFTLPGRGAREMAPEVFSAKSYNGSTSAKSMPAPSCAPTGGTEYRTNALVK